MKLINIILTIVICSLQIANAASVGFKTFRIEKEFIQDLRNYNLGLEQLILDIAVYSEEYSQKNIVLTEIYRTQAEQDKIYKRGKND